MKAYKDIVYKILENGYEKENRTGVDTLSCTGVMFEHNMADGFPILTTKYMPFHIIAAELEAFIRGITDKRWLQDRGCHIWDSWCNQEKVRPGNSAGTRQRMRENRDLGPIYGWQWRHFGAEYRFNSGPEIHPGVDQLKNVVNTLRVDPNSRRMVVSAWNPLDINKMALPPCHYSFQVVRNGGRLDLLWNQRSADVALGLPFNIASYGLLLELLASTVDMVPGRLVGFLGDAHIYDNHIGGLMEQMTRPTFSLPKLLLPDGSADIFDWTYQSSVLKGYNHHPAIKFEVAV